MSTPNPGPFRTVRKLTYQETRDFRSKKFNVENDGRLAALLTDPKMTLPVADARQALYELLNAWQREVVSVHNVDQIGPTLLGLDSAMKFLESVANFGDADRLLTKPDNQDDNTQPIQ